MDSAFVVAPVTKVRHLAAPPERVFELFTDGIATWWPLAEHSLFGENAAGCFVEGRVGGRVYERARSGEEAEWGEVTVWDPPLRLVIAWHPNPKRSAATEVEVRFEPDGSGTRLTLEHRGWERLLDEAEEARLSYDTGWEPTLDRLERAALDVG